MADNESPPPAKITATQQVTEDLLLVAIAQMKERGKPHSRLETAASIAQLLTTVATLALLVYGFFKFSGLDEVAKNSEATSKAVAAQYDKARRLRFDNELSVDGDKAANKLVGKASKSAVLPRYSVGWFNQVTNISKKAIVITAVRTDCFVGTLPPSLEQDTHESFLPFDLPGIGDTPVVTWVEKYAHLSSVNLDDDDIRNSFDKGAVASFDKDLKEFLGDEKVGAGILPSILQPDEAVSETQGFIVRAPRSDHLACVSTLRFCYQDAPNHGVCYGSQQSDSAHLWLTDSDKTPKH